MRADETDVGEANRRYAAAYMEHYTNLNLRSATQLYLQVIELHSSDPEAGYARAQIENIVQAIVPPHVLLAAHVELCDAHFEQPTA